MAQIIKPPAPLNIDLGKKAIFLAGSIEMGTAANWQAEFEAAFREVDVVLLNPRRDEWDSTWSQSIENPRFRAQVEWELAAQEQADIIVMYFAPGTQAPITLLELGLFACSGKLIVCCPDGFWRKGNVDIVCRHYQIPTAPTLAQLIKVTINRITIES